MDSDDDLVEVGTVIQAMIKVSTAAIVTTLEALNTAQEFMQSVDVDGTLIEIKRPHNFEGWNSRKGYTAINTQLVADANGSSMENIGGALSRSARGENDDGDVRISKEGMAY
ncbi:hypothetical protein BJ742DRAFT_735800 [Cladochytrium replicatum]|nr:hypothetical protein BJ742DRAFT_735800 [Cladochytrium replicatum]